MLTWISVRKPDTNQSWDEKSYFCLKNNKKIGNAAMIISCWLGVLELVLCDEVQLGPLWWPSHRWPPPARSIWLSDLHLFTQIELDFYAVIVIIAFYQFAGSQSKLCEKAAKSRRRRGRRRRKGRRPPTPMFQNFTNTRKMDLHENIQWQKLIWEPLELGGEFGECIVTGSFWPWFVSKMSAPEHPVFCSSIHNFCSRKFVPPGKL